MVAKTAEFNYSVLLDHDPGHQYAGPQNRAQKILWFTYKSTTWVGSQTDTYLVQPHMEIPLGPHKLSPYVYNSGKSLILLFYFTVNVYEAKNSLTLL